jgi:transposase
VSSNKQTPEPNGSGPVNPAPRPVRRSFTAEYKAAVVAEYEAAAHGEKSAVLRREGLFHSHVQELAFSNLILQVNAGRQGSHVDEGEAPGKTANRPKPDALTSMIRALPLPGRPGRFDRCLPM